MESSKPGHRSHNLGWILIGKAFVFLFLWCIYLISLSPGIFFGDSPELCAATYCLGIPHPPGYHSYLQFLRPLTFMPLGDFAYRCNLLSALCSALCAVVVYLCSFRLTGRLTPAIIAGISFGLGRVVFSQAIITEVYGLTALLSALFLLALIYIFDGRGSNKQSRERERAVSYNMPLPNGRGSEKSSCSGVISSRVIALAAFILGIGIGVHNTFFLYIAIFITLLVFLCIKVKRWLHMVSGAVFFALGASAAIYIPMRSLSSPAINWADVHDLNGLLHHLFRLDYTELMPQTITIASLIGASRGLFEIINGEYGIMGLFLIAAGIVAGLLLKQSRRGLALVALFFLFNTASFLMLLNFPPNAGYLYLVRVFFIPAFISLSIMIGFAFYALQAARKESKGIKGITQRRKDAMEKFGSSELRTADIRATTVRKWSYFVHSPTRPAQVLLCALLITAWCLWLAAARTNESLADFYLTSDYGRAILDTITYQGIYINSGDNQLFPTTYMKLVERYRHDVIIFEQTGHFFRAELIELAKRLGMRNPTDWKELEKRLLASDRHRVFYSLMFDEPGKRYYPYGLTSIPDCSNLELLELMPDPWQLYTLRNLQHAPGDYMANEIRAKIALHRAAACRYENDNECYEKQLANAERLGGENKYILFYLGNFALQEGDYRQARDHLERALELDPLIKGARSQLGLVYGKLGMDGLAIDAYKQALEHGERSAEVHFNLANALRRFGRLEEAEKQYLEALRLDKMLIDAYNNLGNLYETQRRYQEAMEIYMQALKMQPESAMLYNNLSIVLSYLGEYDTAHQVLLKALSIKEDLWAAYCNLGGIYLNHTKELEKAIYCYKMCLKCEDLTIEQRKKVEGILENIAPANKSDL